MILIALCPLKTSRYIMVTNKRVLELLSDDEEGGVNEACKRTRTGPKSTAAVIILRYIAYNIGSRDK